MRQMFVLLRFITILLRMWNAMKSINIVITILIDALRLNFIAI